MGNWGILRPLLDTIRTINKLFTEEYTEAIRELLPVVVMKLHPAGFGVVVGSIAVGGAIATTAYSGVSMHNQAYLRNISGVCLMGWLSAGIPSIFESLMDSLTFDWYLQNAPWAFAFGRDIVRSPAEVPWWSIVYGSY